MVVSAVTAVVGFGLAEAATAIGLAAAIEGVVGSAVLASVATGALVGAGTGALTAAVTGGDIGKSMLMGAVSGGVGSAIAPTISGAVQGSLGEGALSTFVSKAITSEISGTLAGVAGGQSFGEAALNSLRGAAQAGMFAASGLSDIMNRAVKSVTGLDVLTTDVPNTDSKFVATYNDPVDSTLEAYESSIASAALTGNLAEWKLDFADDPIADQLLYELRWRNVHNDGRFDLNDLYDVDKAIHAEMADLVADELKNPDISVEDKRVLLSDAKLKFDIIKDSFRDVRPLYSERLVGEQLDNSLEMWDSIATEIGLDAPQVETPTETAQVTTPEKGIIDTIKDAFSVGSAAAAELPVPASSGAADIVDAARQAALQGNLESFLKQNPSYGASIPDAFWSEIVNMNDRAIAEAAGGATLDTTPRPETTEPAVDSFGRTPQEILAQKMAEEAAKTASGGATLDTTPRTDTPATVTDDGSLTEAERVEAAKQAMADALNKQIADEAARLTAEEAAKTGGGPETDVGRVVDDLNSGQGSGAGEEPPAGEIGNVIDDLNKGADTVAGGGNGGVGEAPAGEIGNVIDDLNKGEDTVAGGSGSIRPSDGLGQPDEVDPETQRLLDEINKGQDTVAGGAVEEAPPTDQEVVSGGGSSISVIPPDAISPEMQKILDDLKKLDEAQSGENVIPGGGDTGVVEPETPDSGTVTIPVVVYGPDGKEYGSPAAAEGQGIYDWSYTKPDLSGGDTLTGGGTGGGDTVPGGTGGGDTVTGGVETVPGGGTGGGDTILGGGTSSGGGDTITGGGVPSGGTNGGISEGSGGNITPAPADTIPGGGDTVPGGGDTLTGGGDTLTGGEDTVPGGGDTLTGGSGEDTTPGGQDTTPGGGTDIFLPINIPTPPKGPTGDAPPVIAPTGPTAPAPTIKTIYERVYGGTPLSPDQYGTRGETLYYSPVRRQVWSDTGLPAAAQGGYFDADAYFADGGLVAPQNAPSMPTVSSFPTMAFTDGQGPVGNIAQPPAMMPSDAVGFDVQHASPMAPAPAAAAPSLSVLQQTLGSRNTNASPTMAPVPQNPNVGYALGQSPLSRLRNS